MELLFNGQKIDNTSSILIELIESLGIDATRNGVAVAINGEVVPRSEWGSRPLRNGDEIDVITAMQGG